MAIPSFELGERTRPRNRVIAVMSRLVCCIAPLSYSDGGADLLPNAVRITDEERHLNLH
jgi:hypothetical protein